MDELQAIVSALDNEMEDELEGKLRDELETKDAPWLREALLEQILQERHLHRSAQRQLSREARQVEPRADRQRRLGRIRLSRLTDSKLRDTVARFRAWRRETLEAERYLLDPPHKGKDALQPRHRSPQGETLLEQAHDLFYALLFCDERQGVLLPRVRRDFITVTLPSHKAGTLERFMLAVTEVQVAGTWLDPDGVSDDIGATNKILQVEFGDTRDGLVSDGLVAALQMINNLEVNEEILYARIEQLERSTLVE